ncbi:Gfo/Idh/MocA family protein [Arthrobacter celericrescens]|uniref:Gfo/Idh/MocA family protein n=1 Tax=Arthrobacter celericrescens TaxID=2320851 RepID=UPI000EA0ACB4|nr:Gfo/Idh/MocA family oxidoreductase [Arthrobacter celericrescens]
MSKPLGVAVIGAGMAGKSHAAGYRVASSLFAPTLPEIKLVSIGDVNAEFGQAAARRFGYERHDADWRAIAEADDIDVVSVVIANSLHREVVEGLLDAGKHVLCEKPLSDSIADAEAMLTAARAAEERGVLARIGYTYLRSPAIAAIRKLIDDGTLGRPLHFSSRYWTDYSCSPHAPMSWRYKGAPGSGALADLGSHTTYISEFLCGKTRAVSGGQFHTAIEKRPLPLGAVMGHDHSAVSDVFEQVENDDYAAYAAEFEHCKGSLEVSRIAAGHPNSLTFEIFCENGAARYDQDRPAEFGLYLNQGPYAQNGYRQVLIGPELPYVANGMAMDAPGVGYNHNDSFAYQSRAFLEEVAGLSAEESLPRCATFEDGLRSMNILDAVARSAAAGGSRIEL